jgi:hypothetical protein
MKVKLRMTLTYEYEADSEHYGDGAETPERMAQIDQENYAANPDMLAELVSTVDATRVDVVVVQ